MKTALLKELLDARHAGVPLALATHLETGKQALVSADGSRGELALDQRTLEATVAAIATDRSLIFETEIGDIFVQVFNPPPRLIVVGAVHIAEPLSAMAGLAGYAVTVVDPRRTFVARPAFAGIEVSHEWPDEALERLNPDHRTAVVTLTHDPKLDDAALEVALRSPAFYIGSLGSRKTHAARLNRLRQLGFSEADLGRIHGPVGLPIAAETPAEIAVAIIAEITRVRRIEVPS
jgi:xanthine dehydrogenase accessory factor